MKRIAFITESVYPYFVGGQEKRIYEYAHALAADNRVKIVSMKQWEGECVMIKDDVEYVGICSRLAIYKKDGKRNVPASVWLGIKTFFWVLRSDEDILDIDIFPYFPLIFARLAVFFKRKKPIIIGYWAEYWGKTYWEKYYPHYWWLGVFLEKISYAACDQIIANSYFTKEKIMHAFVDGTKDVFVLPPTCIDTTMINSVPAQEKKYDIIYYGRIIAHKHVEHIVDAVAQLVSHGTPVRALIVGDGPDKVNIIQRIAEKKMEQYIDLIEFVKKYEDLIATVKSAKVMVQPSEREGFGITVAEANACGLPVFLLNYPDNASVEIVAHEYNGFVCNDVNDLYKKLDSVLKKGSHFALDNLSINATKVAQEYSMESMKKYIIAYYV